MGLEIPPANEFFALVFVIYFAIGLHEYAHAKFADMAGDDTPRLQGRVTLQLWKHFDPIGAISHFVGTIDRE